MNDAVRIAELTQDLLNTPIEEPKLKQLTIGLRGIDSTTEVILILAKMHENVEDSPGAERLRAFAKEFAAYEATVI